MRLKESKGKMEGRQKQLKRNVRGNQKDINKTKINVKEK